MRELIPRKMGLQISYSSSAEISAKVLYGKLKRDLGEILYDLCRQRGVDYLLQGHLMADHVHRYLRFPPKHSIAFVIGFLKR